MRCGPWPSRSRVSHSCARGAGMVYRSDSDLVLRGKLCDYLALQYPVLHCPVLYVSVCVCTSLYESVHGTPRNFYISPKKEAGRSIRKGTGIE